MPSHHVLCILIELKQGGDQHDDEDVQHACGHVQWSRAVVTCSGHVQWSRAVVTCSGHVQWSRAVVTWLHGRVSWLTPSLCSSGSPHPAPISHQLSSRAIDTRVSGHSHRKRQSTLVDGENVRQLVRSEGEGTSTGGKWIWMDTVGSRRGGVRGVC
jgi:hypothetical protein